MHLKCTYNFTSFTLLIHMQPEFASSLVADICRSLRFNAVIARQERAAAWNAFTNNPVDIVFGDVTAEETCQFLRDVRNTEISPNPHVPFVATAVTSSATCIARARDFGATEFLRFPLAANTLIERIIHIVEHPRMFVKASQYTGPDRRRRRDGEIKEERRGQASTPNVNAATDSTGSAQQRESQA